MAKENLVKEKILAFCRFTEQQGWAFSERMMHNGIHQLRISDGQATTPINFYPTGTVLIQGGDNAVKSALQSWWQQQVQEQSTFWSQETLAQTKPIVPAPAPRHTRMGIARIGSDESGKGDYFGPLVVAAIAVTPETEERLLVLNVCDSKLLSETSIMTLAPQIKAICQGHGSVISYSPERYNQLYKETTNLNLLLAKAHAQAIATLQSKVCSDLAVVDQFADESLVTNALARLGCTVTVEQRPRAEDDTAVAAASIVARAEFVQRMAELSRLAGFELP
ncbi:MAG TPA: ribonuclease HIII, partial [Ktedonobacteraceae bacterium]|nr:ribonuclease HIII [Ktedonobacteraceae bacterium]